MSTEQNNLEEDLSCPVCQDIFRNPVVLSCSHSVCKNCVQQFWSNKKTRECPVCRTRLSKSRPLPNLALKNVCESYLERKSHKTSEDSEDLCELHGEKRKVFCLEEEEPICVVCQASKKHKNHDWCPVDEAVYGWKMELKTALKLLEEKLMAAKKLKLICDQTAKHIKRQRESTEKHIKKEFERLQQFLRDEEEARIAALREEEAQKSDMLNQKNEDINRQISTFSETIKAIEDDLGADDVLFLQNFKASIKRAQYTQQDPQMDSGSLIDEAKHRGNLKFRVWEKMKDILEYTPVLLDPNTAHPRLALLEDLSGMRYTQSDGDKDCKNQEALQETVSNANKEQELQHFPDNPERFDVYSCVLGSEGFSSGSHSWDIEVGNNSFWAVGVTTESNKRKGWTFFNGVWCVGYNLGIYYTRSPAESQVEFSVNREFQRIRVCLDYNRGKVSFSEPLSNVHLKTLTHNFTEKIYPFFCNWNINCPLKIIGLPVNPVLML